MACLSHKDVFKKHLKKIVPGLCALTLPRRGQEEQKARLHEVKQSVCALNSATLNLPPRPAERPDHQGLLRGLLRGLLQGLLQGRFEQSLNSLEHPTEAARC